MPVPKRKRSRARRDKRFANKGLEVGSITECRQCQAPVLSHQACKKCGFYKGKKVLETTKDERKLKRAESRKKEAAKQQAQTAEKE